MFDGDCCDDKLVDELEEPMVAIVGAFILMRNVENVMVCRWKCSSSGDVATVENIWGNATGYI